MVLFVGVTLVVLLLAYFCNTGENVQLHMDSMGPRTISVDRDLQRKGPGGMTRQQALNLWICGGIYVILASLSACNALPHYLISFPPGNLPAHDPSVGHQETQCHEPGQMSVQIMI